MLGNVIRGVGCKGSGDGGRKGRERSFNLGRVRLGLSGASIRNAIDNEENYS